MEQTDPPATVASNDQLGAVSEAPQHWSDCATHNAPAYPPGPCDCTPTPAMCRAAVVYLNGADVYDKLPREALEIEESIYAEVWKAMQAAGMTTPTENSPAAPAVGIPVERMVGRQRTELDVAYFSQRTGEARQFSHQYHEAWEPEDLFCPKCGQQHVWRCDGGGDYYVGDQYICTACRSTFCLPNGVDDATGEQDEQRLLALTPNVSAHRQNQAQP